MEFSGAARRIFREPAPAVSPADQLAATSQEFTNWWNEPMPPEAMPPVIKEG